MLNDFVQKPPPELKFSAVAVLISPKNLKVTHDRMKMVHNVYVALPSIERALLELDPSSPSKPQLVPKNVALEPFGPFHKKNAPRLNLGGRSKFERQMLQVWSTSLHHCVKFLAPLH